MGQAKQDLIVIYHDQCVDGLASAWVLHQKWGNDPRLNLRYVPFMHHQAAKSRQEILDALTPDTIVCFVDVAPDKSFLDEMLLPGPDGAPKVAGVRILDHHKSAADRLAGYTPPVFDGFKAPGTDIMIDDAQPSAARMVWERMIPNRPAPEFLDVINKMDRGDGLVTEDDFCAAAFVDSKSLRSLQDAFNACNELSGMTYSEMVEEGRDIFADQKNRIEKTKDNVMHIEVSVLPDAPPVWVAVVNIDVQNFGRSVNGYLLQHAKEAGSGVAFAWFVNGDGTVSVSIRTDGTVDAGKVVEYFHNLIGVSGGGHPACAAMHFPSFARFSEVIDLKPAAGPLPGQKSPNGNKFRLN